MIDYTKYAQDTERYIKRIRGMDNPRYAASGGQESSGSELETGLECLEEHRHIKELVEKGQYEIWYLNEKNEQGRNAVKDQDGHVFPNSQKCIQRCHFCETGARDRPHLVCPRRCLKRGYRVSICTKKDCLRNLERLGSGCPVCTGSCCCVEDSDGNWSHRFHSPTETCPCRSRRAKTQYRKTAGNSKTAESEHAHSQLKRARDELTELRGEVKRLRAMNQTQKTMIQDLQARCFYSTQSETQTRLQRLVWERDHLIEQNAEKNCAIRNLQATVAKSRDQGCLLRLHHPSNAAAAKWNKCIRTPYMFTLADAST